MPDRKLTTVAAIATILASLSLYPIFSGSQWFWSASAAVIVVAGAGMLTRIRRLPPLVCLVGGVLGLLLYLNIRFEAAHSLLLLIPTPGSLSALSHLAGDGLNEASGYAPPVPAADGILLLVSAGVGLTALLVDLIAVRLRSAAVAGLPLLMLFTEPFAISVTRSGTGTAIVFCLGAAGFLALLSADGRQRIRAWGRLAGPAHFTPDTTALTTAGRRVGLASVVVALCVPLLVPGLHPTRLFQGTWTFGGSGSGSGTVSLPSPVVQLSKQLTENHQTVLTYTTTDPDAATQYLQEYVLGDLTNSGWTWEEHTRTVGVNPRLPAAIGLDRSTPATTYSMTVTFSSSLSSSSAVTFLPLPYPSVSLSPAGPWTADPQTLMVLAKQVRLAGFRYKVTSLDLQPTSSELNDAAAPPASIAAQYDSVPASYLPLLSRAEQITKGAKTELAKALALQTYLSSTGGFSYTLDASPVTDAASLTAFLDSTRRGYCEQFAYAMTVLARLLHIPARYAIGYTAGQRQPDGTWVVRTSDAHAWPELYFSGVGWIRFEPTPAGSGGQGTATSPSYAILPNLPGNPDTSPVITPTSPTTGATSGATTHQTGPGSRELPGDQSGTTATGGAPSGSASPWLIGGLAIAALCVLAIALPGLARITARWLRWRSAARALRAADAGRDAMVAAVAWRQFRADLTDLHMVARPSESPRALVARIGAELPLPADAEAAIRRLAMAAERARYSSAPAPSDGLRADTALARRAIAAAVSRRARLRASLFPMSVLAPTMTAAMRFLDRTAIWRSRSPARWRWRTDTAKKEEYLHSQHGQSVSFRR
jgi:transglutaminase-like putative cysteine protease